MVAVRWAVCRAPVCKSSVPTCLYTLPVPGTGPGSPLLVVFSMTGVTVRPLQWLHQEVLGKWLLFDVLFESRWDGCPPNSEIL